MSKPYIVGISGGTASGKSTIAHELAGALSDLGVSSLCMDSYYRTGADMPKVKAPFNGKEYVEHNHPDALDLGRFHADFASIIERLSIGGSSIEVSGGAGVKVLIVEGILALWDEYVRQHMDLKLYVDCQSDERLVRRIKRFMQWGETFEQVSDRFIDSVRWRHDEFVEPTRWYADLVLNGSVNSTVGLAAVERFIRSEVNSML